MFEEVPRTRRGLARLTARHVVLGPFVIGGGVLLAAVGGSVAVAATVITATSVRASDVPPHVRHPVAVPAHSSPAHRPPVAGQSNRPGSGSAGSRPPVDSSPASHPSAVPARPGASTPSSGSGQAGSDPSGSGQLSSGQPSSGQPSSGWPGASPSGSATGPAGNALIYVLGYDGQRLQFEYAVVSPGAGPNGSDLYRVDSPRTYSATLAADLTITSGGRLCPPAGSRCSVSQLAAAAGLGFFAVAAIDPADQVHSVIEVDNAATGVGPGLAPRSAATPAPSATPIAH
jgi:hypothetical protein